MQNRRELIENLLKFIKEIKLNETWAYRDLIMINSVLFSYKAKETNKKNVIKKTKNYSFILLRLYIDINKSTTLLSKSFITHLFNYIPYTYISLL